MTDRRLLAACAPLALLAVAGCELGSKIAEQTGYRGAGLEQITDPDNLKQASAIPAQPFELPPDTGGPRAQGQNIRLLGHLSQDQFSHLMASMAQWVGGDPANCGFCHNTANMADDSPYRMQVARRMIQMTWGINSTWSSHVRQTGVTCFTCHRGNAVPEYTWSRPQQANSRSIRGNRRGQNAPDPNVGYTALPGAVFATYLAGDASQVRVASDSAFPNAATRAVGTRDAENSYAIMMHVSQSLGVNCTYCHNSQSFRAWDLSRAQRATAWYGIRMVRDINQNHVTPLIPWLPANRRGPTGDALQVNCLTCHQGQSRPMGGVSMLANHPYLRSAGASPPAAPPTAAGSATAGASPAGGASSGAAPATPPTTRR